MGHLVLYLRREHREAVGLDDFLALGLMAASYGAAFAVGTYAFLAVFAAGLALRTVERRHEETKSEDESDSAPEPKVELPLDEEDATDPESAPAHMASAVLGFAEQFERIGEVALVVIIGSLLSLDHLQLDALWFVPVVLLVVRPGAVWVGLVGSGIERVQGHLICWFGIRGIGSVYYLTYAENHGLPDGVGRPLLALTLATVATSVLVHGTTVTPLMRWYERRRGGAPERE